MAGVGGGSVQPSLLALVQLWTSPWAHCLLLGCRGWLQGVLNEAQAGFRDIDLSWPTQVLRLAWVSLLGCRWTTAYASISKLPNRRPDQSWDMRLNKPVSHWRWARNTCCHVLHPIKRQYVKRFEGQCYRKSYTPPPSFSCSGDLVHFDEDSKEKCMRISCLYRNA